MLANSQSRNAARRQTTRQEPPLCAKSRLLQNEIRSRTTWQTGRIQQWIASRFPPSIISRGLLSGLLTLLTTIACAQPIIPHDDATLKRRLASVEDLVQVGDWDRAIDMLDSTRSVSHDRVATVSEQHYLNGSIYARVLLSQLPEEGLLAWRTRKEKQAAIWLEEARVSRSEKLLKTIVEEAFLTRSSEQALLLLGEWAFQKGEFSQARHWWTMLVPLEMTPGRLSTLLRFPDPETPRSDVLARLILCSIVEGNRMRAEWERQVLTERYPDARGTLGGREGLWSELLSDFAQQHVDPAQPATPKPFSPLDVGRPLWRIPLEFRKSDSPRNALPQIWNNLVFWNTHNGFYAYQMESGRPAWIDIPPASKEKWLRLGRLYPPGPEVSFEAAGRKTVGNVTSMLTITDDRVYFRAGGPVCAFSPAESRRNQSSLVCLDLTEGQGSVVWQIEAEEFAHSLRFAGPPLVNSDRVYVLGFRGLLPAELHLLCFERASGQFLWNRLVCSNSPSIPEGANLAECLQMSVSGNRLLIATKLGCICAFSIPEGRPLWYRLYERSSENGDHQSTNQIPERCWSRENIVYVAPTDGREIMALDSITGATIWSHTNSTSEQIFGVEGTRLLTTGPSLRCRHIADGQVEWNYSPTSPEQQSTGTGFLHQSKVWWPTHREILVFDFRSGQMTRRIPLSERDSLQGGNLVTDGKRLILSDSTSVTLFSPFGVAP